MVQDAGITSIPHSCVQYRNEYLLIKTKTFHNKQIFKELIKHATLKAKFLVTDLVSLKIYDFLFRK